MPSSTAYTDDKPAGVDPRAPRPTSLTGSTSRRRLRADRTMRTIRSTRNTGFAASRTPSGPRQTGASAVARSSRIYRNEQAIRHRQDPQGRQHDHLQHPLREHRGDASGDLPEAAEPIVRSRFVSRPAPPPPCTADAVAPPAAHGAAAAGCAPRTRRTRPDRPGSADATTCRRAGPPIPRTVPASTPDLAPQPETRWAQPGAPRSRALRRRLRRMAPPPGRHRLRKPSPSQPESHRDRRLGHGEGAGDRRRRRAERRERQGGDQGRAAARPRRLPGPLEAADGQGAGDGRRRHHAAARPAGGARHRRHRRQWRPADGGHQGLGERRRRVRLLGGFPVRSGARRRRHRLDRLPPPVHRAGADQRVRRLAGVRQS